MGLKVYGFGFRGRAYARGCRADAVRAEEALKEASSPPEKASANATASGTAKLPVVHLVIQNGNLEYGKRRCGFNTKHHSTKRRSYC